MSIQDTFKALDDPVRRQILEMLRQKNRTAGEIAQAFEISFPAVSRHLSILKQAELVRDSREGKNIIYELNTSVLEDVLLWIENLKGSVL